MCYTSSDPGYARHQRLKEQKNQAGDVSDAAQALCLDHQVKRVCQVENSVVSGVACQTEKVADTEDKL